MRAGFRRGSHHYHLLPFVVVVVLLAMVSYQVVVHSNLWHSLYPKRGNYLVRIENGGKEETLIFEDAIVRLDGNRLVVIQDGRTAYYPIPFNAKVEVKELEEGAYE